MRSKVAAISHTHEPTTQNNGVNNKPRTYLSPYPATTAPPPPKMLGVGWEGL